MRIDAQSSDHSDLGAFCYTRTPDRADHCLVDVEMIAIPGPCKDSVAGPGVLLGPGNDAFYSYSFFVEPKTEWPTTSLLKSKRIRCGVKPNQYPTLVKLLREACMVELLNSDDSVNENSIFGVWKKFASSQPLICRFDLFPSHGPETGRISFSVRKRARLSYSHPTWYLQCSLMKGKSSSDPIVICRSIKPDSARQPSWFRSLDFLDLRQSFLECFPYLDTSPLV